MYTTIRHELHHARKAWPGYSIRHMPSLWAHLCCPVTIQPSQEDQHAKHAVQEKILRPNSWTTPDKSLNSFPPCFSQSLLQLCLEISFSSNSRNLLHFSLNSRNLLQFIQFSYVPWGRIFDKIQSKLLRFSSLLFTVTSTALPWDFYSSNSPTSFSFYNSVTVHYKGERRKPNRKPQMKDFLQASSP